MNHPSQSIDHRRHLVRRSANILAALILTGCAGAAGWLLFQSGKAGAEQLGQPTRNAEASAAAPEKQLTSGNGQASVANSEPVKAVAGPAPDPRLLRVPPPVIPAVKSPEARRMILDMQNTYRCQHSGNRKVNLDCIPGLSGDDVPDMQALCASLRQSLGTLPDSCYVNAALPQVANPRTPSALMEVLYKDLAQRPNPIRLRTLFILAGIDGHPLAQSAMSEMSALLRTDFQKDWGRWEQTVSQTVAHEERGMRSVTCRARQ